MPCTSTEPLTETELHELAMHYFGRSDRTHLALLELIRLRVEIIAAKLENQELRKANENLSAALTDHCE